MVGLSEFCLNFTKSCTTVAHSQHPRKSRLFIRGRLTFFSSIIYQVSRDLVEFSLDQEPTTEETGY